MPITASRSLAVIAAAYLATAGLPVLARVKVDPALPKYEPTSGVAGQIKSVGSDTMNNLMALWAETFRGVYPGVRVEVEGKGSSTAPPALISGAATFGPMSRAMKETEIDAFEKAHGYKPAALPTAIDMLAVYIHRDNPLESLTLQQVDAIFSKTRNGGHDADIRTWGDVGLTGEWANKPISLYGRNSASGTYGYFKKHALFGGDYRDSVKEQPGSSSVVQGVANDLYSIGYSGIGYKTADVKAVALALDADAEPTPAAPEFAYTGDYPLARFLYLYVNHRPGRALDPLRREFVRFVFSAEGQSDVLKDGYFPVSAPIAVKALQSVDLAEGGGA